MIEHRAEDIDILNEEPSVFWIGKGNKAKKLEIEMLTMHKYYKIFLPRFVTLINLIVMQNNEIQLPEGEMWKNKKGMDQTMRYLRVTFSAGEIRKNFIKLLNKVGYLNEMSVNFFEKNVKPTVLVAIFLYVYKHNIEGFKKKVLEVVKEITGQCDPQPLTFIDSLSKKGGLKEKLKPRFRPLNQSESQC